MTHILKISIVLFASLLLNFNFAEAKKVLTPEEQKEKQMRAIEDSIVFENAKNVLENFDFVIPADRISFKSGKTVNVTGNTNFISAQQDNAVVQISKPVGAGLNGIGGITVKGRISNLKTRIDKKGNFSMEYSVMGTNISARITINLPKNSNRVIATVYPNFNSQTLTVYGSVVKYDKAKIFQGHGY